MTTLRKDGLPVVPVCIECKHFKTELYDYCNAPQRPGAFDMVYGKTLNTIRCADARKSNDLCGTAGNWYEPATPPKKPTYWSRLKRWLNT